MIHLAKSQASLYLVCARAGAKIDERRGEPASADVMRRAAGDAPTRRRADAPTRAREAPQPRALTSRALLVCG
jgi:hypothetical protein